MSQQPAHPMRPLTPTMRSLVAHVRFQNMVGAQRLRDMVKATIPNNRAQAKAEALTAGPLTPPPAANNSPA